MNDLRVMTLLSEIFETVQYFRALMASIAIENSVMTTQAPNPAQRPSPGVNNVYSFTRTMPDWLFCVRNYTSILCYTLQT